MNDVTLKQLKTVVEQAVRPVRATLARRRKMREELLAHLVSVFEEEAERLGDEQTALRRATQRFGEPQKLAEQLQTSVPRRDRLRLVLERLGYQPGESIWHLAAKYLLFTLTAFAAAVLLAMPILLAISGRYDMSVDLERWLKMTLGLVLVQLVLLNVVLSLALTLLLQRIGPALIAKRRGRISLVILCVLASPFVLSGAFAPTAVLFVAMVRQIIDEWRYQADWA